MPTFSIILPTFNRGDFIQDSIQSVLAQTYPDWELIIVDDGSTDGTGKAVSRFADKRIRYFRQNHEGVSAARNRGIGESQSAYIAFIDSDDVWMSDKLEHQFHFLRSHPEVGLLYGQIERYYLENGKRGIYPTKPALNFEDLLNGPEAIFTPNSVVIRRECLEKAGLFDPQLDIAEDYEFWLRIAKIFPIAFLPGVVAQVRMHAGNSAQDEERLYRGYIKMRLKILQRYRNELSRAKYNDHLKAIARHHYLLGVLYLKRGRPKKGVSILRDAITQDWELGRQFVRLEDGLVKRLWLLIKPYFALLIGLVRGMIQK